MTSISRIQHHLIKASQAWALGQGFSLARARELRREAILLNHAYYLNNMPVYQQLARAEGIGAITDLQTIKRKMMLPDDIFKSYSQEWLDTPDFARMNDWLSGIYHKRINVDVKGAKSIDDWLELLSQAGISIALSSGTSGCFSFVPRAKADWTQAKTANICYLAPLLTRRQVGPAPGSWLLKQAARLLPPAAFAKVAGQAGLGDFDAFFLGFRQGKMGNQALMQELAPVFRKHSFLYDLDLSASALRCLRRGGRTEEEGQQVERFQAQVVGQREQHYLRLIADIKSSSDAGRKIFIFGAPYQFKELGEMMSARKITLTPGSVILFGGGWKSFTGEAMTREELVRVLGDSFNLPPENILEGYSMTEISTLMLRCDYGRFHLPPILEPVIFDEALNPLEGDNLSGLFGFLDPMAVSYPGFIISGDQVHLVDGVCGCGLIGPAVTDIGRARSREIKGCGGIMGSIAA